MVVKGILAIPTGFLILLLYGVRGYLSRQESCIGSVIFMRMLKFLLGWLIVGRPTFKWWCRMLHSEFFLSAWLAPAVNENLFWRNSVHSWNSKGFYTLVPSKYWVLRILYFLLPHIFSTELVCIMSSAYIIKRIGNSLRNSHRKLLHFVIQCIFQQPFFEESLEKLP